MSASNYTGRDNLEVMREARKYNKFLFHLICSVDFLDGVVVDFGAGNGIFAKEMWFSGYQVTCVESDQVLSDEIRRLGLRVLEDIDLVENRSVEYIYSLNVLEHIEDDFSVAQCWFENLRPGGRVLVYVPAFRWLMTSMDYKVGHFRRYTAATLCDIFERAGFLVEKKSYLDCIGVLATLFYKMFDNGGGEIDARMLRLYDKYLFPVSRLFDFLFSNFFGKNIFLIARKPFDNDRGG
jgi:SAM-dependent methyltransferase